MPIFEFKCTKCDYTFETIHYGRHDAEDCASCKCSKCGSGNIKKLISNTAPPQFKGSGFYSTDYKKKSGPKDESGE